MLLLLGLLGLLGHREALQHLGRLRQQGVQIKWRRCLATGAGFSSLARLSSGHLLGDLLGKRRNSRHQLRHELCERRAGGSGR